VDILFSGLGYLVASKMGRKERKVSTSHAATDNV
jgi:hypothetical protein